MINTFEDWIEEILNANKLCSEYKDKVDKAMSNKRLVDIVLDSNGVSYLCEMEEKGIPLPYEVITSRFSSYINGKYVAEHKTENGKEYTSSIYCCYSGDINGDTTLMTVLGSNCNIYVNPNHIIQIYVDRNSKVFIDCPKGSKAIVRYYGEKPTFKGNVELINKVLNE